MGNNLIDRQAAIDAIMGQPSEPHYPSWYAEQISALPSAQPELIAQGAYVRGFEQGRTQGMLDAKLKPTCNQLATDSISRQAAIDAIGNLVSSMSVCINVDEYNGMRDMKYRALKAINELPSAQPELSLEQVLEYCRSRCITVVEDEVLYKRLDSAYTEGYTASESKYRKMWDEMPKIIRCRDCVKRKICRTTTIWAVAPDDDWFCADAERGTDATTI